MIDKILCQARLIVGNSGNFILSGNVGGGDDSYFIPGNAVAVADAANAASRTAAAHGYAVNHSRECEVVHILGVAGNFVASFLADDRVSKKFFFHLADLAQQTRVRFQYPTRSAFSSQARKASSASSRIKGSNGIRRFSCERRNSS